MRKRNSFYAVAWPRTNFNKQPEDLLKYFGGITWASKRICRNDF